MAQAVEQLPIEDPSIHALSSKTGRDALARSGLCVVVLYRQDHSPARLWRTVSSVSAVAQELVIVGEVDQTVMDGVAAVAGPRVPVRRACLPVVSNDQNHAWMLWLWSGELLPSESQQELWEWGRLDSATLNAAVSCRIRHAGTYGGDSPWVGAFSRDEIRLWPYEQQLGNTHRQWADQFQRFFALDVPLVVSDIVIDCPTRDTASDRWELINPRHGDDGDNLDAEGRYARGCYFQSSRSWERAEANFLLALQCPTTPLSERASAWAGLARAQLCQERLREAIATCENAKQQFPTHAEILFVLGMACHRLGYLARALGCYRAAHEGSAVRGSAWRDHGVTQFKSLHQAALVHAEQQEFQTAEVLWREVLQIAPTCLAAHRAQCECLIFQQRWSAVESFAMLLQEQGTQHPELWTLGVLLTVRRALLLGELDVARRQLERAIRREPENVAMLAALAKYFVDHGPADEVIPVLEELIRYDPQNLKFRYHLGREHWKRACRHEARQVLETCLQLDPDCDVARASLAFMEEHATDESPTDAMSGEKPASVAPIDATESVSSWWPYFLSD